MVQDLARSLARSEIEAAIDDYISIVHYLNEGLKNQVQLDITSLERAIGRNLQTVDLEDIQQVQEFSIPPTRWRVTQVRRVILQPHSVRYSQNRQTRNLFK
jgi:hypothetical protein